MAIVRSTSEPLTPAARKAVKAIFFTLFIDLISFSIIFPLFPAMLRYYTEREGHTGLLAGILSLINALSTWGSAGAVGTVNVPIVLFGGFLGSLYGILQFLFAPVWGTLSDRIGRKPILVICLAGIALSYLGWFFAGSFLLLVLSRILSGIMAGNLSTATAAVADVTSESNRSRGMAMVGIAFGMGFILGPAIGGIFSRWDLTAMYPDLDAWGVNPFSVPAGIAFVLSVLNFLYVLFLFDETLPKHLRGQNKNVRTLNPLAVLETRQYPGVAATILTNFIFITLFSGMEFTLTFLTSDRLQFTPVQNGMMFVYVGVMLALVQGGYVRRKAHLVGEKNLAIRGLSTVIPGLFLVGFSNNIWMLFGGLTFLAVGSAMVIPCLTSLVSLYAPATDQGRVLGIFRSMGSLSRALGPLIACVMYWKLSPAWSYTVGALMMIFPLAIARRLPSLDSVRLSR